MEEINCDCDDWKNYIDLIDNALIFQQTHTHSAYKKIIYPEKAKFKYCPWCGKVLLTDEYRKLKEEFFESLNYIEINVPTS